MAAHALIISLQFIGEVLELADRRDLGSRAARREGSTPSFPIRDPNWIHYKPDENNQDAEIILIFDGCESDIIFRLF